jgi:hypothetical protein
VATHGDTIFADVTAGYFERYVACDKVQFASSYEGFGMPIIEANAALRVDPHCIAHGRFVIRHTASAVTFRRSPELSLEVEEFFVLPAPGEC